METRLSAIFSQHFVSSSPLQDHHSLWQKIMDHWIAFAYVGIVLLSFVACCCGDWPIFEGTVIQRINHCCTGDGFDLLERAVGLLCGEPGRQAVASVEYYCCERPNPILQLFYFAILGGTYVAVVNTSFEYIPGYYISSIHSDPGTITAANVSEYLSTYPYDGVLYEEKICSTCNITRPARSKHCSICGRCVARFDHHCGWTNTCIGENNLRYFLAFLLWHCCLCFYGAYIIAAVLAGKVKERKVVHLLTVYFGVDRSFRKLFPHIIQWLLAFYNAQLLILLFLVVISLLLAGFLGYHIYLVLINTTTNEAFKWENYRRWQTAALRDKDAQAKDTQNIDTGLSSEPVGKSKFMLKCSMPRLFRRRSLPQKIILKKNNIYNKGILRNAKEVFFPQSWRLWFRETNFRKLKKG